MQRDAEIVGAVRETIGEDRDILIDVQNCWYEVGQAIASIRAIEEYRPFFIEAPLPADNLAGYARLADAVDTCIAVGDWGFTTRFEFEDIMEKGRVDVVHPSSVRSGGIREIARIAEAAYRKGADLCATCVVSSRRGGGRNPPRCGATEHAVFRDTHRISGFTNHLRTADTDRRS